jgi:acyltransferase
VVTVEQTRAGVGTNRSAALDVVRVLAVVAVVAGHAYSLHPWAPRLIFSWHVPIFFVLSGYLWTPGRALATEIRKRSRTLLVPYVGWLIIVTAGWWLVRLHRGRTLHEPFFHRLFKGGAYIGMPYSAFWFITALFFAAVMYRLIEKLAGPWTPVAGAGVGIVGLVIAQHEPHALASVWWAAGLALPCLVFVATGTLLKLARPHVPAPAVLGALLLLIGGLALRSGVSPLNVKSGSFGDPAISVLTSIGLCVGLVLLVDGLLAGSRLRGVSTLGAAALPVVFAHGLFLVVLAEEPFDAPVWVFVTAVTVPWLAALVIARSRRLAVVLL